jgi:hypothetical protein
MPILGELLDGWKAACTAWFLDAAGDPATACKLPFRAAPDGSVDICRH